MKYLKVWTDFEKVLAPLEFDEIGRLFLAMLHYAETGEEPEDFTGNESFLWAVAKRDIDTMKEKSETLRQNGLKGGRPKRNQEEPNETNENQTEPNESLKEKKRKEKKGNEIKRKVIVPPTLEEVTAYCRERNNNVNPQRFVDFYTSKGWKVGKEAMKDWKACIRTWEGRDGERIKKNPAGDFAQRDYSGVQTELMNDLAQEMQEFKKTGA